MERIPTPVSVQPPLNPAFLPLPNFKIFLSPLLFSIPPAFKVIHTVPPTLTRPPPAPIRHTNLPKLMDLHKYKKGNFSSSTVVFNQKSKKPVPASYFHSLSKILPIPPFRGRKLKFDQFKFENLKEGG